MCIMRGIIATVTATRADSGCRGMDLKPGDCSKQIDLEGINKPPSIDVIYITRE